LLALTRQFDDFHDSHGFASIAFTATAKQSLAPPMGMTPTTTK
jgi:hypothetical protein